MDDYVEELLEQQLFYPDELDIDVMDTPESGGVDCSTLD